MSPNPTSWLQNLGIAIEVICPALALLVVLLRIYIRVKTKNFGWGALAIQIIISHHLIQ